MNEDKTRMNIFIHTDKFGYEEMITINIFGPDNHVNCVTTEGHAYSFYPVDDIEKYETGHLIGHILSRILKLVNVLDNSGDQDNKVIAELVFEYLNEVYKSYK